MHGKQPLWPSSAMSKHIRPAAKLGIVKHDGPYDVRVQRALAELVE